MSRTEFPISFGVIIAQDTKRVEDGVLHRLVVELLLMVDFEGPPQDLPVSESELGTLGFAIAGWTAFGLMVLYQVYTAMRAHLTRTARCKHLSPACSPRADVSVGSGSTANASLQISCACPITPICIAAIRWAPTALSG